MQQHSLGTHAPENDSLRQHLRLLLQRDPVGQMPPSPNRAAIGRGPIQKGPSAKRG